MIDPTTNLPSKYCSICHLKKELTDFHRDKSKSDGYHTVCKDCRSKQAGWINHLVHPEGMKICSKCKEIKPATTEYFLPYKRGRFGLSAWCRHCNRLYQSSLRVKRSPDPRKVHPGIRRITSDGLLRCAKCYALKPATTEYFSGTKDNKLGLSYRCKECLGRNDSGYKPRPFANRELTSDGMLRCTKCGQFKPAITQYFYKAKYKKYGLNSFCKKCHSVEQRKIRSRRHQLASTFTVIDWNNCLEYFEHRCAYCGRPEGLWRFLAQDHFIPLAKGGAYTRDNIVPACQGFDGCNNKKNDSDPIKWVTRRFGSRKAKVILDRIQAYFKEAIN